MHSGPNADGDVDTGGQPGRRDASRGNLPALRATDRKSRLTEDGADSRALAGSFQLSKWYLDCVSERGEALIGYWAELRWRRLAVHYASTMLFAGGRLRERSSLRAGQAPQFAGGNVEWLCDALDTSGVWRTGVQSPINRVLYRRGNRTLEWRCLQPLAEASVRCEGIQISGSGYTECLTLTLAPWELPIAELRWGRAHFPQRSMVWIDWTGPEPMRLVLVDAEEAEGTRVTDTLVSTPRMEVRFTGRRVLREGPVASTSIGSIPGVRQAISRAGLLIDERKWLSTATLEEGGVTLQGNAIHEVVQWR